MGNDSKSFCPEMGTWVRIPPSAPLAEPETECVSGSLFLPSAGNTQFMGLFGRLQTARISGLQPLDSYPFQVRMPYKIFGKISENARSGQKTGKNARSDWEFYHCFRGSPSGRIRVFAMVSALSCLDWESRWA